jgi:N-acetylneuraminic acid mutarotase
MRARNTRLWFLTSLLLAPVVHAQLGAPPESSSSPDAHAPWPADLSGKWYPRAPLNNARQETGGARIGDQVYVVGGLRELATGGMRAMNTVEVYDVAQDTWSASTPMPDRRDHMVVVSHGGKLYVLGGFEADFVGKRNFWMFDPALETWTSLPLLPEPRGAGWAVVHEDKIYYLGGSDENGNRRNTNFVYAISEGRWSVAAPMVRARLHLTAAAVGDYIYAIGGRRHNYQLNTAFSINERYDPDTDEWTTMRAMPTPRSAMGTAVLDGKIHVFGGEAPTLFDVHEVYDPATDGWSLRAPMAVARHAPAAVTIDGGILCAGGGVSPLLDPSAYVDLFVPHPDAGSTRAPAGVLPFTARGLPFLLPLAR